MKVVLAILLMLLAALGGVNRIAEINAYTKKAQAAMANKQYAKAVKHYEYLLQELEVSDDRAKLNLAHAYFNTNQHDKAYKTYTQLLKKNDNLLQSVSALQLGILAANFKDYPEALNFYKQALIIDPTNEQARYNYELLKKYLRDNPQDEQDQIPPPNPEKQEQDPKEKDKNQPQKKPDDQGSEQEETDTNEENKNNPESKPRPNQQGQQPNAPSINKGNNQKGSDKEKPGGSQQEQKQGEEPGEEEGLGLSDEENEENGKSGQGGRKISDKNENAQTRYQRLKKMNISPEKANMILDAMRESEQQYIQQIPRKRTSKKDKSKPDW